MGRGSALSPGLIGELSPGTTYHVRAYATNSAGTGYGSDIAFTTSTAVPTVTTTAVSSITATSASSGGNVTLENGASVTARGVCWGTSGSPTIVDSHTSDGTGTGTFTSAITGLSPGATYEVRAYATNSAGTAYGSGVGFKTAYASTLYVGKDATCDGNSPCYTSIQTAVTAAGTGGSIKIAQGTYSESITLNDSKTLTLQGGVGMPHIRSRRQIKPSSMRPGRHGDL